MAFVQPDRVLWLPSRFSTIQNSRSFCAGLDTSMPRSQSSSKDLVLHRAQQHFLWVVTRVLGDDCSIKWASVDALVPGRALMGGVE